MEEHQRRQEERSHRQTNRQGHTTMISPFSRLMVQSLRDTTPEQIAAAEQWCDTLLSKKILVVVGKSTCPRCIGAVKFLTDLVVQDMCHVVMLDSNSSVPHTTTVEAIQDVLWDRTGCRTVPRIFLRGESLGGYDDVLALHDENLLIPTLGASR